MKIPLPPKRFESDKDSKYDAIRTKPWFRFLAERRAKLSALKGAYGEYLKGEKPSVTIAMQWGVDSRELRDYVNFVHPGEDHWPKVEPIYQAIINQAYSKYCLSNGDINFRVFIGEAAEEFGIGSRAAIELWEVNPTLYPKGYETK